MLKWLLTIAIVVFIFGLLTPRARRNQPARGLPGDITLRWRDRDYFFPFVSTLLFSAFAIGISLLI
ncbi:MAG: DUF2905 domain-containing protein [Zoogloeaceae bacterium]|nr:DUF2905 domain-containing protein [Zoogloeaceae bacterium]